MSRLIDADTLKANVPNTNVDIFENCRNCSTLMDWQVKELIDKMPTIDAVEVKHGEWLRYGEDGKPNSIDTCIWQCDKCLETYYGRTERIPNYCPNCGAKMDGERRDPCSSQDS